mgnify:CR=1 FL=1
MGQIETGRLTVPVVEDVQPPAAAAVCAIMDCIRDATRSMGRWTVCAEHAESIRRAKCYDR